MQTMIDITHRPTLSLSFDRKARRSHDTLPTGTLSRSELKRIVAEMVG
ncbi:hypothetical protein LWE61_06025 [Sphingobium sufflavum]|jgi:hypothetical protein|nr:hypothetical protein [Sphingobium sufflavum]MCE7796119.1 hypothetical protein [Sphingobium sufflavum]